MKSIQADISKSSKRSWIMKQYSKKLFSLAVLCSTAIVTLHADNDNGFRIVPFLQWRSQGRDESRLLYGQTSYAIYQQADDVGEGCWGFGYGTFDVTVQYDQTFRSKDITRALFGPALVNVANEITSTVNNCHNSCEDETIVISGLDSTPIVGTSRGMFDLMAENFLLPRDFVSTITFRPKVQDVVVNFDLFVGLDRWLNGLYFRLYGPVVWNRATLKPSENIINAGTESVVAADGDITTLGGGYAEGYFDVEAAVPTQSLFTNALSYFGGCDFPGDYTGQSVTVEPLRFAKFSNCNLFPSINSCDDDCNSFRRHKTGFAELRGEFGYNYIRDNYRLLINLQAAAPTGSKVKAEYLLPAQIGNGHHWELGVGLGGAWRMWCNEEMERSFNFIVQADITHLFKAKQQRTFDLICKPLSRYMLAEQLGPNNTDPGLALAGDGATADLQFADAYAPVANFSTRNVKVSIGVQGDVAAMFNYTCRGFSWDLGYNFWAMSSSKFSLPCDDDCPDACGILPFPVDTWALKGDASVGGYYLIVVDGVDVPGGVSLAATEGGTDSSFGATIFAGVDAGFENADIDTPIGAQVNPDGSTTVTPVVPGLQELFTFETVGTGAEISINTSNPPVFISIDDLDIKGAEQRGLSHKVFTHLSYTWRDCSDRWMPYVGAGVSAEFGSHSSNDDCEPTAITEANCDMCPSSVSFALSKWAVEIKGGVSFH